MRKLALSLSLFVLLLSTAVAQEKVSPSEAAKLVGKKATVCGQVASANFAARSRGRPTFLNLDRPYPNQIFTVVIWGQNRAKFSPAPESAYRAKRICVSGTISSYRGQPQIVVSDPSQINIQG